MAIYFVSDHHFEGTPNESKKLRIFLDFIEYIKGCDSLFIVGDFFDFYFEYKTQIPKAYFELLTALRMLKEGGTKIYYIVGNHDYWVDDFFTNTLGIEVYKNPLELTVQNRKILLAHGDEFLSFSPIRWLLRNKLSIFLFYWLHPDIAQAIGRLVSRLSTKTSKGIKWNRLYNVAKQKFSLGFDAVIFGHIHTPKHIRIQGLKGSKDFILLGDWINHFTYGKLVNGKFILLKWKQPSQPY